MDLYNKLDHNLQIHVLQMQMTHNVLPQFMLHLKESNSCHYCAIHGMPCLNCYGNKHYGALGPPFIDGVRTFIMGCLHGISTQCNMINYMLSRRVAIKIVHDVYALEHRERHRYTPHHSVYSICQTIV